MNTDQLVLWSPPRPAVYTVYTDDGKWYVDIPHSKFRVSFDTREQATQYASALLEIYAGKPSEEAKA